MATQIYSTREKVQAEFYQQLKAFELLNVKFTGEELGGGSFGYVVVVEVPGARPDTRCAAKILHSQLVQEVLNLEDREKLQPRGNYRRRSLIESFKNECILLSEIRHPNVVEFFGICYPTGVTLPALVMELLMTNLHDYLEDNTKKKVLIPLSMKNDILLDISKGLVYLHRKSIIHRDLTAANVLLTKSLTAKIADLGMARLIAEQHEAKMSVLPGNPNYMPPEAITGDQYSAIYGKPIDSFSMGHILLFTLTQMYPELLSAKYLDSASGKNVARSEVERREYSFQALYAFIEKGHPLAQLARMCLHDNPEIRPSADEIMQQFLELQNEIIKQENHRLVYDIQTWEHTTGALEKENAELRRERDSVLLGLSHFKHLVEELQQTNTELNSDLEYFQNFSRDLKKANAILSQKVVENQQALSDLQNKYFKMLNEKKVDKVCNPVPNDAMGEAFEGLSLIGGDDGPCSMVNACSKHNNDSYLNSLASNNAEFNKQAENAWKVDTPTQEQTLSNTAIAVPCLNGYDKGFKKYVTPNLPNLDTPEPDATRVQANHWQHNTCDYENRPAGYKPAPEVKQKTEVPETSGHQQTNEPSLNLPNLDTPEPDTTRVQAYDWKHNTCDHENRPAGNKPIAKRRNKLDVEKSSTGSHLPTPSIETPYKPHTSPLSSLLLSNDSGDFRSARSQQPTTLNNTTDDHLYLKQDDFVVVSSPESSTQPTTTDNIGSQEREHTGEYEYVSIDSSTTTGSQEREHTGEYEDVRIDSSTQELINTIINLDSSEQPPSRPPGSLSPQPASRPPGSLSPRTRPRLVAVSKGSPTTSGSSIVATPHSATATALSPQSPDVVVSKKHLAVLSNGVARDRTYYTNLDKGLRSPVNSPQSPQLPQSQQSPQYSDTKVDGTWTCSYCTNLVFDSAIICDICSHERTTLV